MFYPKSKSLLCIIGSFFFSLGMLSHAQSQDQLNSACPTGYAILGEICWNETNGDVVNPRRQRAASDAVSTSPSPAGHHLAQVAGELPLACATQDLAAWTLVELRGEAQSLPSQVVADAFFEIMDARRSCRAGRSEEALATYARVIARMTGTDR